MNYKVGIESSSLDFPSGILLRIHFSSVYSSVFPDMDLEARMGSPVYLYQVVFLILF